MPRSRNTRVRPKDTSRAEARRRHRDELRGDDSEELDVAAEADAAEATAARPRFALPDVGADIRSLPEIFRKPLVWLPFGMLLVAFVLELLRQDGALPAGQVADIATLYIQLTLPPTALFVFFIGGFVAPKASWLVGALLGVFDALLISILVGIAPAESLEAAGVTEVAGDLLPLWGIAIIVGIFAAAFAAWYRKFLRSSQERARLNRAAREREQAAKAKEQARKDRAAAREARRRT